MTLARLASLRVAIGYIDDMIARHRDMIDRLGKMAQPMAGEVALIQAARLAGELPPFALEELRFSRSARCLCGAGLAYVTSGGGPNMMAWICSRILLGEVKKPGQGRTTTTTLGVLSPEPVDKVTAEGNHAWLPFSFWDLKSETATETTRPKTGLVQ